MDEGMPFHSLVKLSSALLMSGRKRIVKALCTIAVIYQSHIHWGHCCTECCTVPEWCHTSLLVAAFSLLLYTLLWGCAVSRLS